MEIKLSKEQCRELLLNAMVGSFVRGGVADSRGEDWEDVDKINDYILSVAKEAGFNDLLQIFHGKIMPSDELIEEEEAIIDEYNDDQFWHELEMCLGQRDFEREKTEEDKKYIKEHDGWLPDKINNYYEKYEKEFEENGIMNLEIKN